MATVGDAAKSGTPRKGCSGGYQGEDSRAEVAVLPCLYPSLVVCSKEAADLRSRRMFEFQGLHIAFLLQARAFLWGLNPDLQTT